MEDDGPDTAARDARDALNPDGKPVVEVVQPPAGIARHDAIWSAVTQSTTELLRSSDPDRVIPKVLELIGTATGVSRVQLFENEPQPDGRLTATRRYEWDAPGIAPTTATRTLAKLDTSTEGPARFLPHLAKGEACAVLTREADEPFRRLLESIGVVSVLFAPIFVEGKWWGQASFDDCNSERAWSSIEVDALTILAALAGAAIARTRDFNELAAAGRIVENSSTILFRIGAQNPYPITYISRNVSRYGYSTGGLLASPSGYFDLIHPDDVPQIMDDIARIADGRASEAIREGRIRAADGRYVWFEGHMSAVHDEMHRVAAIEGLIFDIDSRKMDELRVERYTFTDQLTGLANRLAFTEQLRLVFSAAKRGANPFAILYIDLDHFKDVNDVLGHPKGDELLKLVAQRLKDARRTGDVIARFGGDEFAIMQIDVSDPSDAGALAARVLHDLAEPSYDLGTPVDITASIGIAVFTPDIAGPEDMLKQADVALYRAKDSGRNQFHFHSEQLDIAVIERVTLAGDLRHAVDRGEIELYYQPEVEVPSGRIIGLEALTRWHHPKRGLLYPSHFIPVAEKTGTILPLGQWAIENVCQQIVAWRTENLRPPTVAINVSAVQMKSLPEFDGELMESLRKWRLEPDAIEIELTESVLMETTREHREIIDRLRALGVSIAIDDFGTGYSSLGYLRAYQVSHIKIAQEFVQDIREDSGDVAIVRAAISLARELGIKVIAEGVETAYQLQLLTAAGCRYVQGYYFSAPVPAARAAELLRQGTLRVPPAASAASPPVNNRRKDMQPAPSITPKEGSK